MAVSSSSQAGLDTFEKLEIEYEHAYGNNPLKKACVEKAIPLLPRGGRVLDVGCGTGKPVAEMLSLAGHEVLGVDISPRMVHHASARVKGSFIVADILTYEPEGEFAAIFIMFSLLQLTSYAEFHDVMFRYAKHVQPNGYLVFGTVPADNYVKNGEDYDATGTYAVNYPVPFMGVPESNLVFSNEGLVRFVSSLGFRVVRNDLGIFKPDDKRCEPEHQQYLVAQRVGDGQVRRPQPDPTR
ncbi:type 11 methyltransferas-like protein [Neohortaea acidophila]|uniref:Type 11 methyltransferas-like protein n=1 Tax=Neohortaea acidophila TaxID=245834 RepID=A0A6A6Q5S1_9PEZI|nr:type 11 methyltransferas-like protein [Neohortaea acidophila]KAF2487665.1 type 11 methyltransferas-like protein [Neohortaea acidophila]